MIEGKVSDLFEREKEREEEVTKLLHRGTKRRCRRPENHGFLRRNRNSYRIYLSDCPAFRGRKYGKGCNVSCRPSVTNSHRRHSKQRWGYMSFDVWSTKAQSCARKLILHHRLPLVCLVFAIISVMTTSSRMIFAFARYIFHNQTSEHQLILLYRDGGLPASRFFATVHPTLKIPLNALILSVVVVIAFGCIFLGSSR